LIFVGLEIRQSREIAESAAYQARADASMMVRTAPLESPELLSAFTKILAGRHEELEPNESTASALYYLTNMIYLESVHYQYINGFITEEQWQSNIGDIEFLMSTPAFRAFWDQQIGDWRASFVQTVEDVIHEVDGGSN
jgi:hypothetical protein